MKFTAFERSTAGTASARRMRNAAKVPGIVYGAGEPAMIELDHNALFFALKKEAFHSSLLEMDVGGKTEQVLLRGVQMHPFRPIVLHVDFQRVDGRTRIKKKVPLHFTGEENSPAVKTEGCLINHVLNELQVTCLASQLPEFIEVDLSEMTKGQSLHVSDIKLPAGTKVVTHGKPNPVIASAVVPVEEEEVAPVAVVAAPDDKKKEKKSEKQNKK
jgi:large subunit ribosomal protein L25